MNKVHAAHEAVELVSAFPVCLTDRATRDPLMLLSLLVVKVSRSLVLIRIACHAPIFFFFEPFAQPYCLSVDVKDHKDGRSVQEQN